MALVTASMIPGVAIFANNPLRRRADAAEARVKSTKTQADQAKRETKQKLLPDSVASVLAQIAAPVATALLEFNDAAAEKTLARWMAIVGVVIGKPAGVVTVSGKARETIESLSKILIDHLAKAAEQSGKPMSADQIGQLTRYAKRQVKGGLASGNIGSFETVAGNVVNSKMAVFITDDMHEALRNIPDPTKKVSWLVEHVKMPKDLHEYGVLKVGRAPVYGAVAEGALTTIDAVCKYAGWKQILNDEAKALTFQKTWEQDVRATLGGALYVSAIGTGVGNVVNVYGTWRNLYATGMTEQMAGKELAKRAGFALRVAGALTAAVSGVVAVMDLADGATAFYHRQWALGGLQITSGAVGIVAARFAFWAASEFAGGATVVAGLSLTGWGVILAVVLVAIAMAIDHIKGDTFAQWLERTYWGNLKSGRYEDFAKQQADFNTAMAGA
jgi:hypothetical protein